jgi:hypothetical protein
MPYTEEICLALVRVLEHASFHKDVRLAGYAANADFWAAEVRHALDCIAGYEQRFNALKEARTMHAVERRVEIDPAWVTPTVTDKELGLLRQRVLSASTRFFRLCRQHLSRAKVIEVEQLLGIRIEEPGAD